MASDRLGDAALAGLPAGIAQPVSLHTGAPMSPAALALDVAFADIRDDARFVAAMQRTHARLGDASPAAVAKALE